jgi:protein disulfide-isomerase
MRLLRYLAAALLPSALATPDARIQPPASAPQLHKRAISEPAEATFNGKTVPPITELSGKTFDETTDHGYWLVEWFSPYCVHCQDFAPTWQTLYEFYYTQEPVPQAPGANSAEQDLNSFTRYYDFHFARVDCVANGDLCNEMSIPSFPSIVLYKNGEQVEVKTGAKDLKAVSEWVESILESIRPGSRPQGGPKLPKVGADHAEAVVVNTPTNTAGSKSEPTKLSAPGSGNKLPASSFGNPNPHGKSVPLTAENFQRLVTMTRDPWFVKFYAPWCSHCQALAPNWQGMARQMEGQLNIGEVNCDVEKRLCKDVKVRGYPTLHFFRGGERIEYDGLRGLGDLVSFANKAIAVADGVGDVTAAEFEELEKKEEVIFLYFYDHATTSEDFAALDRLIMSLIGHAKLVKTNDQALRDRFKVRTWPRLLVSRDGVPSYYDVLSPRDMRDFRRVLNWMQSVWLPIVPELTASNARDIMDGKLVVLGILSRDRPEEFLVAKREIKNAALEWIDKQTKAFQLERQELRDAKQLRIEEAEDKNDQRGLRAAKSIRINMDDIARKEVGFAWVDGVFWERWIRTQFGISVREGEKVVVNDEDNKRYWDNTATGNAIVPSRTSILETLPRIVANPPKISPKSTTTALGHVWWVLKGQVWEHPLLSSGVGIGLLVGLAMYTKKMAWRSSDRVKGYNYFKVGEKGGPMDGLLGGNFGGGPGKTD